MAKSPTAKILIVDDQPENIRVLMSALQDDYAVIAATNGTKAAELAMKSPQPDLILLDVMMPDVSGYQLCEQLKSAAATHHIPIIFVTALSEAHDEAKGFEYGGADFIVKPANPAVVRARVKSHLTIRQLTQQLQAINDLLEQKVAQRTIELNQALNEVKSRTQALHRALYTHALTGLPSRASLIATLQALCDKPAAEKRPFVLMLMNLVRFSLINNSLGHEIGDQVLKEIGQRLNQLVATQDVLYQVGGDEFCILSFAPQTEDEILKYANTISETLGQVVHVDGYEIVVHACVGIVQGDDHYATSTEILRDADTALQKAKAEVIDGHYIFRADFHEAAMRRLDLESALNQALEKEEFVLFYQPIINLETRQVDGFEALIRWQRAGHGLVPPNVFIPCLEETGLIIPVGRWVMQTAIQQLALWQQQFGRLTMSVNLAAPQFSHPNLLQDIDAAVASVSLLEGTLKLEVTESGLLETQERILAKFNQIRDRGISISIDDFGTGYSSLSYLQQLPVDILKIDRCFVKDITETGDNSEIARAVISMGAALNMSIIAEGCETETQVNFLHQLGCQFCQGYFFSKPMSAPDATQWLQDTYPELALKR
ncbi:two-component system response regulator [Leptolyngbya iicbica]|uniref:EAL domain-containing protein n=2 Tax=Cyanophyceae TaxID=3028117 RepID=A0A4Q7E6B5_9CYAN|nr:EAL domain-containing protein [Leptolyngbya sp. LK]RZM77902.1 EAL domain-containing protein [Leptolyngbya sp. LK]